MNTGESLTDKKCLLVRRIVQESRSEDKNAPLHPLSLCLQRRFPEGGAVNGAAQGPEHCTGDRGVHARRAAVRHR